MANTTTNSTEVASGYSLSQFFTTLAFGAAVAAIEILLFIIIRNKFKRIYEPKTYIGDESRLVTPLPKSFCCWLPTLLTMPQENLIRSAGLDAYLFSRYLYIHALFFLSSFVIIAPILLPIYVTDGKGSSFGKTGLDLLTFGNILPRNSSRYVAPLVLAYVFIGAFLFILYREMKIFVEKRQALFRSHEYQSRAPSSTTTILLTTIPKTYMSEDVLFRIFNQYPGGVKYIWLNRNLKDLPDRVDERTKLIELLEATECKLIKTAVKLQLKHRKRNGSPLYDSTNVKDADSTEFDIFRKYIPEKKRPTMRIGSIPLLSSLCFGKKVDTITYCKNTISQLNTEIEKKKATLHQYPLMNSAFIQFNKQIAAHLASQTVISSIPLTMTPVYNNVIASNIVWSNLNITYKQKKLRELIMLIASAVLVIFWAIPVAFVGFLSNITYLTEKLTFLQFIYNLPSVLVGLITGLLPTVLLAILMALLPIILTAFAKLSGIPTKDGIDLYVQGSYFVFQVVQVFLVVTISSSVSSVILSIIQNPSTAGTILAANVPTTSNFFLSFIALQGLTITADVLLQIVVLISFYFLRKLFDNTPRKKWTRFSTLSNLNLGVAFPPITNFVVITLVYSIISPLILLISGIAFGLFYVAYTYNILYVVKLENCAGGHTFSRAIYQSFTGIYLMEIMLATLFFLAQNESGSQSAIIEGALMCLLIAITIGVHYVISASFRSLARYLPADAEEFSRQRKLSNGKFSRVIQTGAVSNNSEEINDIGNDNHESNDPDVNENETEYMHPALRDPQPILWIPQDLLGIAEEEVQQTHASGLNLEMSTKRSRFDQKLCIKVLGPPPRYPEIEEKHATQTRF